MHRQGLSRATGTLESNDLNDPDMGMTAGTLGIGVTFGPRAIGFLGLEESPLLWWRRFPGPLAPGDSKYTCRRPLRGVRTVPLQDLEELQTNIGCSLIINIAASSQERACSIPSDPRTMQLAA